MGEADLARPGEAAAAHERRVAGRVVGAPEGPASRGGLRAAAPAAEWIAEVSSASSGSGAAGAGQPARQHRLAGAGRPDEQQVVAARGGDLEGAPRQRLAADVGQVGAGARALAEGPAARARAGPVARP